MHLGTFVYVAFVKSSEGHGYDHPIAGLALTHERAEYWQAGRIERIERIEQHEETGMKNK